MDLKIKAKGNHKQWSKLVIRGTESIETGDCEGAIASFKLSRVLAVRMMDDTILKFDGDVLFLDLYNHSTACLQEAYQKSGDSAAAEACLMDAKEKYLAVLRNPAYPLLVRGRAIRALKGLIKLAVRFYDSEGQRETAYVVANSWIKEVKGFVARMPSLQQAVAMS